MGFFSAIGKGLSQLDPTRKSSIAGKITRVAGTGGLSILPQNTVLGKIGAGVGKSLTDAHQPLAILPNALGAAVGNKGAAARVRANVAGLKRQAPVLMAAGKGFVAGGPWGAVAGGVAGVAATYVAPEFARPLRALPSEAVPLVQSNAAVLSEAQGSYVPAAPGDVPAAPSATPLLIGGALLLLL